MRRLLIVLQNAWAKMPEHAAKMRADPALWRRCLARTRTGMMLAATLGRDRFDAAFIVNASDDFASESRGVCKQNIDYVRGAIAAANPDIVLACGRLAGMMVEVATEHSRFIRVFYTPHPCSRGPEPWTKGLTSEFYDLIERDAMTFEERT